FFFSSRRRHTRFSRDWSSDVCSSDLRILKAITNPAVRILGHPTGRLLLSRNGYPIAHQRIIDACAELGVVIELNAHPRRLDLDRSEERRVGKECRSRWWWDHQKIEGT